MMKKNCVVLLLGFSFFIAGCKDSPVTAEPMFYDFFPLKVGNHWTYDFSYQYVSPVRWEQQIKNGELTWLITDSVAYQPDSVVYNVREFFTGTFQYYVISGDTTKTVIYKIDSAITFKTFTQFKDGTLSLHLFAQTDLMPTIKRYYENKDTVALEAFIAPKPRYSITIQKNVGLKNYFAAIGGSHTYPVYKLNLKNYIITH